MKKSSIFFLVAKLVYVLGMDELSCSIWLLPTLVNAEKNQTMTEFTKMKCQMSNRHKDFSLSRIQKDHQNVQKMLEFLTERDPFHIDTVRINLKSGEVADESVNVLQAQAIGESLIQCIAGTSAFECKFRKKNMVIIIKINASVNIEDGVVEADPWFFFQRLIIFIQLEEINDAFNYELCIRPSSLFDKKGLIHEAHEPELKHALLDQVRLPECTCLISFKITIMFLMGCHFCKDFHVLLEGCLMKYVNHPKTIC